MSVSRDERLDFRVTVLALDRGCVAARPASPCEGSLQAHHVLTQGQLRRAAVEEKDIWDPANGICVCERHHRRHHARYEPIPKAVLPQRCLDFASRVDLVYLLDRYYP